MFLFPVVQVRPRKKSGDAQCSPSNSVGLPISNEMSNSAAFDFSKLYFLFIICEAALFWTYPIWTEKYSQAQRRVREIQAQTENHESEDADAHLMALQKQMQTYEYNEVPQNKNI